MNNPEISNDIPQEQILEAEIPQEQGVESAPVEIPVEAAPVEASAPSEPVTVGKMGSMADNTICAHINNASSFFLIFLTLSF